MSSSSIVTAADYVQHHLQHFSLNVSNFTFTNNGFWTLNLDSLILSITLGCGFLGVFYYAAKHLKAGVPGKLQNFVEVIIEFIDSNVKESFTGDSKLLCSIAMTIFLWVFLMNFMDLLPVDLLPFLSSLFGMPYFRSVPTADPNVPLGIALAVFFLILYYNIKAKGGKGFIKEVFTAPFGKYLFFFNFIFRVIEECVRPVSLSLRLFGNLFAGELIFILLGILPWWSHWVFGGIWTIFHLLIILIQAFIFMTLSILYMSMAQDSHSSH